MPTTQVKPSSSELLQNVANLVGKARKVLVVTGAGISTNSGIPDFRSENGLYSLIQEQFDLAASRSNASAIPEADEPSSEFEIDEPPVKRRKTFHKTETLSKAVLSEPKYVDIPMDSTTATKESCVPADGVQIGRRLRSGVSAVKVEHGATSTNTTTLEGQPSSAATGPQAEENSNNKDSEFSTESSSPLQSLASSPLLSCTSSHTSQSLTAVDQDSSLHEHPLGTPRQPRHRLREFPTSSSPLSSPPPILFDPYESLESATSNSSETGESPPSSNPFSSQSTAVSSLKNIKGRDLFDCNIWSDPLKTSVFYTFATTLRQKVREAQPTITHKFLGRLRDAGKLARCYTQNIDEIEARIPLCTEIARGPGGRRRKQAKSSDQLGRSETARARSERGPQDNRGPDPDKGTEDDPESPKTGTRAGTLGRAPTAGLSQKEDGPSPATRSEGRESTQRAGVEANDSEQAASLDQESNVHDQESSGQAQANEAQSGVEETKEEPKPRSRDDGGGVECVYLHGSLNALRCFLCGRLCKWDEDGRDFATLSGQQPECPYCAGATAARQEKGKRALGVGKLRPDIVLYGEEHPSSDLISPIVQHDLTSGPDLLLIMGTSLRVHGLKVMVREFAKAVHTKGGKVVFINFTKPSESTWGDVLDYWVQWDCDAWVDDLRERKPLLWLSAEEAVEYQKTRRESIAEKKRESIAVKKRDSLARKESIALKKRESIAKKEIIAMKKQESLVEKKQAAALREAKLKPIPIRPNAMRDDQTNGAYLTFKILEDLASITGRPLADLLPRMGPASPPVRKARRSAPALLQRTTARKHRTPLPTKHRTPLPVKAGAPQTGLSSKDQFVKAAKGLTKRRRTTVTLPQLDSRKREPSPTRVKEPSSVSQVPLSDSNNSILDAVKSNPRVRKRKTIDGVPVSTDYAVLDTGHRARDKENVQPRNRRQTAQIPYYDPSLKLPNLKIGQPTSGCPKPPPLEPYAGPPSPRSPLASISPNLRPFFLHHKQHPMALGDPLVNHFMPKLVGDKLRSPSDQLREETEAAVTLSGLRSSR